MKNEDRSEFAKLIDGMFSVYGKEPSLPAMELYWDCLQDLTIAELRSAVISVSRTMKWLPKIAELREAINKPAPARVDPGIARLVAAAHADDEKKRKPSDNH